jgi:hypothetical protein
MTAPRKPTATETMRALETMSQDDEAEREMHRIAALSPEQLDRELVEAGIDPAQSRSRGEAIARKAARLAAEGKAQPPRRIFSRTTGLLLAAAMAVLFTWNAGPIIARLVHPREIGPDNPTPEWLAQQRARVQALSLRTAAHDDCAAARWASCLQKLDDARALDAAGDGDPLVQADRRAATQALAPPLPPAPTDDDSKLPPGNPAPHR